MAWGTQYSFGVFFKPVLNEFGWTRAVTAGAYSLNMILTGIFYIIAGRLADRFGPRIVLTVGGCFIGPGYLLMSTVNTEWQYYLYYGVLISVGMGCVVVPLMSTVARWFTKGRGLASGIVISGVGVGIVVMPLLSNKLISAYDWRTTFFILGIIALVLIITAAQFLRRAPDQLSPGTKKAAGATIQVQGMSPGEAIRTRQFWLIVLVSFILGYIVQMTMAHTVPHVTDIGIAATTAATVLSVIGFVSIFGKISMGSIGDKIGNRNSLIIVCVLMTLAFIWVRFSGELWMLYLFAVLFGLGYAGASASQSPLMAEYFGLKSHGVLYGFNQFAANAGGAMGSFLAGFIFDTTGSYNGAFYICIILGIIGLILSIMLHHLDSGSTSSGVKTGSNT